MSVTQVEHRVSNTIIARRPRRTLRDTLEATRREIVALRGLIEGQMGANQGIAVRKPKPPKGAGRPTAKPETLALLRRIQEEGGLVSKPRLKSMAEQAGVLRIGPLFRRSVASLSMIHRNGHTVVALTQRANERLKTPH